MYDNRVIKDPGVRSESLNLVIAAGHDHHAAARIAKTAMFHPKRHHRTFSCYNTSMGLHSHISVSGVENGLDVTISRVLIFLSHFLLDILRAGEWYTFNITARDPNTPAGSRGLLESPPRAPLLAL